MGRPRKWTPETILASIHAFVATESRVPHSRDFHSVGGPLPHAATVRQYFDTEADAIRAAGFEPIPTQTKPLAAHAWRRSVLRRTQR